MKRNELFSNLILEIRKLIFSDDFLNEFRVPNHFTRKRKLTLQQMTAFLLFHNKCALDQKLGLFNDKLPEFDFPKVSKQALSRARYGIQYQLFEELFNFSAAYYYGHRPDRKKWLDKYFLFAVDGSDFEVPSHKTTFEEFGKQSDKKNPDLFWSMALASTLYDVLEDMVVDATIRHQFFGERELAVMHLSRLADLDLQKDAIVIFDRGYFSADLFQECVNTGCKCLMRLRRTSSYCLLGGDDVRNKVIAPDGTVMECRVLKVTLSTGETEYLITNVMDSEITCSQFRELYFERWKIETKYYEAKEHWLIEEFTGKGALAVKQDFYISLLHINLASLIKSEADEHIRKEANPANVYQYQARKTYIIGRILALFIKWVLTNFTQEDVDSLILDAAKKRSQIQPGRTRKRKRRTRARKHYDNRKVTC